MKKIHLEREMARLIILQRIELLNPILKKIRKLFGRYLFSNFFSKYFVSTRSVANQYYNLMEKEFETINKNIDFNNKKILSIGSGMGGLELIINKKSDLNFFDIVEKNYVSKKIKYGWDENNQEGYNNLKLLESFLINNGMKKNCFKIYDYDKNELPKKKFDIILSLFSLDYHYDFNIYLNYFKKVSDEKTLIIFDTIRSDYFKNIFKNVVILKSDQDTVHKSKRIVCNEFIYN